MEDLENLLILFRNAKDGSGKVAMIKKIRAIARIGMVDCKRFIESALSHVNVDPTYVPHPAPLPDLKSLEQICNSDKPPAIASDGKQYVYDEEQNRIVEAFPETKRLLPAAPTIKDIEDILPPVVRKIVLPSRQTLPTSVRPQWEQDDEAAFNKAMDRTPTESDPDTEGDAEMNCNSGVVGKDFPEEQSLIYCKSCLQHSYRNPDEDCHYCGGKAEGQYSSDYNNRAY
jgi:hypothetical protein